MLHGWSKTGPKIARSIALQLENSRERCIEQLTIKKVIKINKKHLKNVGPIRHNEPPHAHSADVASGTVARRLRIDVYDDDNDNA